MFKYIKKKWKAFLVLIGLTTAICLGAELLPVKPPIIEPIEVFKTEKEIYEKFVVNKELQESFSLIASTTQFKTKIKHKDDLKVKIGEADDFKPVAEISKWDGEIKMKVKPKLNSKTVKKELHLDKKKIKYKEDKKEFHFYEIKKGDETINGATSTMDAFEIEVVLLEKPKTNIVEMEIETQGLDFFYQPELTQKEKDDGAFMPENVIGSYAVYHSEKQGDYTKLGKKNYMTGKAFHIYRPLIIDSASTTIWGVLNIDNGILTVEIPQEFLDNAVYPVRHAAGLTFGYDTFGASAGGSFITDEAFGSFLNTTNSVNRAIDSISVASNVGGSGHNCKGFMVNASTLGILDNGITGAVQLTTGNWTNMSYSTKPSVVSGTTYSPWIVFSVSSAVTIYRDAGTTGDSKYESDNDYTSPTNPSSVSSSSYKYSVFATLACATGASASDFTYHKSITLEADEIATTTTSFPVLATTTDANLKTTTHGGHINFDDARDLVFLDTDQTTLLDFEIESYATTTGALVAWVDVSISSTTDKVIYMYYGDSDATLNYECAPQVYDDNFVMVQHMQETPAGTTYDSTSNNNDGTTSGMNSADQVTGQVGGSLDFDGDDYVDLPNDLGYTTQVSAFSWFKSDGAPTGGWHIILGGAELEMSISTYSGNFLRAKVAGGVSDKGSVPLDGTWHLLGFTFDGSTIINYIDGNTVGNTPRESSPVTSFDYRRMGRYGSSDSYYLNGVLDEVRISNTARTAGWIETEYNNQVSVGAFLTIGSEQTAGAEEDDPDTFDMWIKDGIMRIKDGILRIKN